MYKMVPGKILLAFVLCMVGISPTVSRLENGAIYTIRLIGGIPGCKWSDFYLGFANRTCGALAPSVGPVLRSGSTNGWFHWNLTIVEENENEQIGYITAHYRTNYIRCPGSLATVTDRCLSNDSKVATLLDNEGRATLRLIPLAGSENVYRIVLKDRNGYCSRFLGAPRSCSSLKVGYNVHDRVNRTRWLFTKHEQKTPPPSPTPTSSEETSSLETDPPAQSQAPIFTSSPNPTSTAVIPAPTIGISQISSTAVDFMVSLPDDFSNGSCTIILSPGNASQSIFVSEGQRFWNLSYSNLLPAKQYYLEAICYLINENQSSSEDLSFVTLGEVYDPPRNSSSICNGRGETIASGACVCDSSKAFIPRENGGCMCNASAHFVDGIDNECECDAANHFVDDGQDGCECDAANHFVDDGQDGCVCDAANHFVDDGQEGCECDAANHFVDDGEGGCECDSNEGFGDDGEGGCECDANKGFIPDGQGGCECDEDLVLSVKGECIIGFYLHENNVTVLCPDAVVGSSGVVDGVTYTKRNKAQINTSNAPTTCTSGISDFSNLFAYETFNGDVSHWDTSSATSFYALFWVADGFNKPLGNWNTSLVTDIGSMFGYTPFNQPIGNWDTSNVKDMSSMFEYAEQFNQDISGWNTSSLTDMKSMFFHAINFNQDIGDWDTSSVTTMDYTFYDAWNFNQDISGWDTGSVVSMGCLFSKASKFNQNISGWNVSSVQYMWYTFWRASAFNQNIGNWDTGSVKSMNNMFRKASAFNQDIGGWDVSSVTNMDYMFAEAPVFNQDLSGWCVQNIKSTPYNFAYGTSAWTLSKPLWGQCP